MSLSIRPSEAVPVSPSQSCDRKPDRGNEFDWIIVGGGPIGVHVAVRLLADARVSPARLCIVDPNPQLLHCWHCTTASTGMRYLRSPAVHHLGVSPFGLLQHAGRRKRDRRKRSLFLTRFKRPSVELFESHCAAVIEEYRLAETHLRDRAEHIDLGPDSVQIRLATGRTLQGARVVLALGNSEQPHWPEETMRLRDAGGRVSHIFDRDEALDPNALPESVAILGGGISAAQLAVRLADQGKRVTVIAHHAPREHQFDSAPGWIGPKYMRGFSAVTDFDRRRAIIQDARHRGSMPPDVRQALRTAIAEGSLSWRIDTLTGGTVRDGGAMELAFAGDTGALSVEALVLATGFSSRRPGGAMVDALVSEHALPVAACGYPVPDIRLRWHERLYVTGPLAELELGPVARNLTGGRRAAERIANDAKDMSPGVTSIGTMARVLANASALLFAILVLAVGCQSADDPGKPGNASPTDSAAADLGDTGASGELEPLPPQGNLKIEEVYYSGAVPTEGIDRYYSDQFIELVNVADAPVMIGGLLLGDAYGLAGAINRGDTPGGPFVGDEDFVYLSNVWRIPGTPEEVLLDPGASLVIAQDAGEHNPYSPIDLSDAAYETYVEQYGGDMDDAFVPNLESIWYTAGYDWLVTVFGPTIVVLDADVDALNQVGNTRTGPMQAPAATVVDTMEALMDAESGDFKRLHESVDRGFIHVSGTYTGESVRRRRDSSGALIDTDDSGADFEVLALPEPGVGFSR